MNNLTHRHCGLSLAFCLLMAGSVFGQTTRPKVGVRAGLGTDISFGVAYGGGVNYLLATPNGGLELGVVLFGGSFDESTDQGIHTYDETTDLFVFGAMANYLINYTPEQPSTFFIAGAGLASVAVDWEERSKTDNSLGTPLPGGGSMQSADGSAGGSLFNLGVGRAFKGGFDVRAELPVIVSFSAPGESSAVIPTLIVTAGLRF